MVVLTRIGSELPEGFDGLAAAAASDGVRGLQRIGESWEPEAWSADGHALFAAYLDGQLAGVGGVTPCPDVRGAERMRRFYVAPRARRQGVGRSLASAAMQQGLQWSTVLTCNARASRLAPPFWEALGFTLSERSGITHIFKAG